MQRLPSLFFLGIILWFVVIVSLLWKINYIHFDSSSNHMKSLIRRVNGYDGSDASSSIDDGQGDAKKRQQQQLEEDTKISLDVINGINLVLDPHYLVIKVPRVSAPGVESSSDKRSAANELRDAMGAREEDLDDPNANSISYESSYSFHLSKQITDFKIKVKIKITAVNGKGLKIEPDNVELNNNTWDRPLDIRVVLNPSYLKGGPVEVFEIKHQIEFTKNGTTSIPQDHEETLNLFVYESSDPPKPLSANEIGNTSSLVNPNLIGILSDFLHPPDLPIKQCETTILSRHTDTYKIGPESWIKSGNRTSFLTCYGQNQPNNAMYCIANKLVMHSEYIVSELGGEDVLSVLGREEEKEYPIMRVGSFRFVESFDLDKNHTKKRLPNGSTAELREPCSIWLQNEGLDKYIDITRNPSEIFAGELKSMVSMQNILSSLCGTYIFKNSLAAFNRIHRQGVRQSLIQAEDADLESRENDYLMFPEVEKSIGDFCTRNLHSKTLEWRDTITAFVTRFEYVNLYHTVTEIFSAYISLLGAEKKLNRSFVKEKKFRIVFLDAHAQGELDSLWSMFFKVPVFRIGQLKIKHDHICLGETVFVETGYSADLSLNTQTLRLGANTCWMDEVRQFSNHFIETEGLKDVVPIKNNVVFILRDSPKLPPHPRISLDENMRNTRLERTIYKEDLILPPVVKMLKERYKINVNLQRFSQVSFREQMRIVREAEVVISLHGAALSHLLWAPETFFVELAPPQFVARTHFYKFALRLGSKFARITADSGKLINYHSGPLAGLGKVSFLKAITHDGPAAPNRIRAAEKPTAAYAIGADMFESLIHWTLLPYLDKLRNIKEGWKYQPQLIPVPTIDKSEMINSPHMGNHLDLLHGRKRDYLEMRKIRDKNNESVVKSTITTNTGASSDRLMEMGFAQLAQLVLTDTNRILGRALNGHRLCIIVPFRDGCGKNDQGTGRQANLNTFILHMKQHLQTTHPEIFDWRLIIVEQSKRGLFNKGALFNTGIIYGFDCDYFVFHDVDQVPESTENDYSYPKQTKYPIHMCTASSQFNYKPAYHTMVGGALMMTREQAFKVNGYTNEMFSWGREDDEMYERITRAIGGLNRLSIKVGRYKALDHPRVAGLDLTDQFKKNDDVVARFRNNNSPLRDHYKSDGLTTISTTVQVKLKNMQFDGTRVSKILVDVLDKSRQPFPPCDS